MDGACEAIKKPFIMFNNIINYTSVRYKKEIKRVVTSIMFRIVRRK